MISLKVGMYVRCPVDINEKEHREFLLGQITKIDELLNRVKVKFFDFHNVSQFFGGITENNEFDISDISRCRILNNSDIIYKNIKNGVILDSF